MHYVRVVLDANASIAGLLVISRFRVSAAQADDFARDARAAIAALAGCAGFESADLAQSTDEPDLRVISSRWASVGHYRRALSSFDVKLNAVPLLSLAIDEPSAFEVVHHNSLAGISDASSGLAADADSIGLGHAAGADVPPVTT